MNIKRKIKIAVVDDHQLFRDSLTRLINSPSLEDDKDYLVTMESSNGRDLLEQLQRADKSDIPEIILLDLNMPILDGFATLKRLTQLYPSIKIIMLTMQDDQDSIIKCIKAGATGYLPKDISPEVLVVALAETLEKGYFYEESITGKMVTHIKSEDQLQQTKLDDIKISFSDREKTFLRLACSELTYKQIANEMYLSERTVEGYREAMFTKLRVTSRVGLVLAAIKRGIFEINPE